MEVPSTMSLAFCRLCGVRYHFLRRPFNNFFNRKLSHFKLRQHTVYLSRFFSFFYSFFSSPSSFPTLLLSPSPLHEEGDILPLSLSTSLTVLSRSILPSFLLCLATLGCLLRLPLPLGLGSIRETGRLGWSTSPWALLTI